MRPIRVLVLSGVLLLPVVASAQTPIEPPPGSRIVSPLPEPEPGHDREYGPIGQGEQFRLWTPITEAEANAVDPNFRLWVDLIRTGRADKRVMRNYWFARSRLDPFTAPIPAGWRERGLAVLRDETRTAKALQEFSPTTAGTGISPHGLWVPIGPWTIPGRMTGLARPEGHPGTLYAAAADGGVWRTRDFAQTWENLTEFEATQSGGAILLDPTAPGTIWFGTGEGNGAIDNYGGIGVLKSTDDGRTWTRSNAFSSAVRRLAIHPSEPTRLYAAGDSGCYRSTDAGATFSLIASGGLPTNAGASDVLVRPDNADIVFCAIWGGSEGGIYRSTDRGATWSLLTGGLPAKGTVGRISLAVSKSDPQVLLAGIDTANGAVYKTTDGGTTWTQLAGANGFCGGQCWYDNVVGIDSADPNVLYAGGVGHRRSLDGGATWGPADSGVHVDHHFILTPAPGEILLANDGGVYRSTNQGASWENWGLGLDTTQYYGICRHPSDADWAFGGTQDNGSHRRRLSDDPDWQQRLGGDGGMCMTGPPGSNIVVGEYQNLQIQRSADDGQGFGGANGGIPNNEPHPWVGILVADPSNRLNMWTATNRIYRSLDGRATNWVQANGTTYFGLNVSAIEVAPSNSNVVYVGYDLGGLKVTTAATGPTPVPFTDIRKSNLPQRGVRRIRVHPQQADTVYVVFSGYGAGKIWKSVDRGGVWTDATGDLPDVPVNDLVIDAANSGTLVAATDLGVFRTDSDGAHWYGWSAALPTVASIELTWDAAQDRLRLGTHGRSMWEWVEAATAPTALPDGAAIPGLPLTVDKLAGGQMRVRWDARACPARDAHLFWGDLADVASTGYLGAHCGLGSDGVADVPLPVTPSGSAYFLVASSDGAGNEGPHSHDTAGVPSARQGVGFCGIVAQASGATCP